MRRNQLGNLIRNIGMAIGITGANGVDPANFTTWIQVIVGIGLYAWGFFEKGKE